MRYHPVRYWNPGRENKIPTQTNNNLFINLRLPMNLDSTWCLDVADSPIRWSFSIRNRCKRTPGRGDWWDCRFGYQFGLGGSDCSRLHAEYGATPPLRAVFFLGSIQSTWFLQWCDIVVEEVERLKAALAEEQARVRILSLASFVILKSPTDGGAAVDGVVWVEVSSAERKLVKGWSDQRQGFPRLKWETWHDARKLLGILVISKLPLVGCVKIFGWNDL